MGKISKEEQARLQGMSYALKVAKEKGIDGLENDLKMRNIVGLPIPVSRKALDECIMNIKNNVVDTFIVLLAATLHDEFGFGEKRVQRAIDRFNFKAECIADDYCTWDDHIQIVKDELGIELTIRKNDKDVKC
jgi:hypothetical protein